MTSNYYTTVPLDHALLATPFGIQTGWYVLTGAACTGKTTLLELLAERGYPVLPESARQYFEAEQAKGRSLVEIRGDGGALQRGITALQVSCERDFPAEKLAFLDRGVPDTLTFFRVFGLNPNAILPHCFYHRYAGVFILDRLPLHRDQTLGPEDDAASNFLDAWLARDYGSLGYEVIRVPPLLPNERLNFVLNRLGEKGELL